MDQICRTCHYFDPVPAEPSDWRPSLGVCAHPTRTTSGVRILVQPREMRCRRGFGEDDWAPADGDGLTDTVVDERPLPPGHRRDIGPARGGRPGRDAGPRYGAIPVYLELRDAVAD